MFKDTIYLLFVGSMIEPQDRMNEIAHTPLPSIQILIEYFLQLLWILLQDVFTCDLFIFHCIGVIHTDHFT